MKKILLSLFVGFVGIISFCNAEQVVGLLDTQSISSVNFNSTSYTTLLDIGNNYYGQKTVCLGLHSTDVINICFRGGDNESCDTTYYVRPDWDGRYFCFVKGSVERYIRIKGLYNNGTVYGDYFYLDTLLDEEIPELSSSQCQEKYSLIPISSVDQDYCINNNFCPENSASWSELVINDIVHQSAPLININIPQELDWSYTVDENEFDLGISGYNVDTDYIDGIITTQNAKPSTEDFNKIITGLIPLFVPGLVIILFLRFVFKFIKKIF